ncbi:MAG TPA: DUF721 domain-containing protein [Paracoccus sp. (in: a-proteobacteria)]|uniref:DUF721 domain-containing protein n=1 Tax=uncultured Paracoccus sp. TaxID=189685 RepID=UPI00263528DF|nr:DUF721 domain-containing protein [uncultured Paracoccus sp.]HMQ40866.1 DUF721 domain-containing protein [Paracoccus sp. (in: a-proteobacteria)]HMR35030.1 DUF721 domain-containing protein [Paracoccus sp. (in: a-proteobacteria)]
MSQPRRRSRGFRQAASLVAEPIRHAAEGRGFAVARLLTHWPEIAGPEVATRARPVKIAHGRGSFGATLTLLTTGAAAPLLEMQLPAIRDRVNACYGYNAISRIVLTQTAPTGFAEGQAQFDAAPAPSRPPDPDTRRAAEAMAAGITDPALQAAVTRLAMLKLSRKDRTNRKAPR